MLRRFIYAGLLLALVATPAVATHVNEPTAPITGIRLDVFQYPDRDNRLTACDGSETVDWDKVRMETFVQAEADPSEHFSVTVNLRVFRGGSWIFEWGNFWRHQNVAPHGNFAFGEKFWQVSRATQWQVQEERAWKVLVEVVGDESGTTLTEVCEFKTLAF